MVDSWNDLEVYQNSFELQRKVFVLSRKWPAEERYALTDQIRRSSRSISSNLAEAWAKRRYPAHFLSKLADSDGELQETLHWLRTAYDCGYIDPPISAELAELTDLIGKQLGTVINKYESFCF
ncbi:MAG: four helix bundle protein [Verrucomicrobiota bacterium]